MANEVIDWKPSVGQWLYASCSAEYDGEIVAVGEDSNGQPVIDIRIEHPTDLIDCEDCDEEPCPKESWQNPLTWLEVPAGVKVILREVQYRVVSKDGGYKDRPTIECNTPGSGCYRCTKYFCIHFEKEAWVDAQNSPLAN